MAAHVTNNIGDDDEPTQIGLDGMGGSVVDDEPVGVVTTYMKMSQSTETTTKSTKPWLMKMRFWAWGSRRVKISARSAQLSRADWRKSQTYLLTEGADEIKAIVKNLDGRFDRRESRSAEDQYAGTAGQREIQECARRCDDHLQQGG